MAFIARLAPDLEPRLVRIWLLEMIAAPLIIGATALYQMHLKPVAFIPTAVVVAVWVSKGWMEHSCKRGR